MVTLVEAPRYRALGSRIAELRRLREMTQDQLADSAHISRGYPPSIEAGRRLPSVDVLRAIARALGADFNELSILAGYASAPDEPEPPRFLREEAAQFFASLPFEVPIYEDAPIHAGGGGVPIQMAYLPAMQRKRESVVGLVVRGDCMEPTIHEGDVAIIDTEAEPTDGQVVAVETEDGWSLRRYLVNGNGRVFECDNRKSTDDTPVLPATPVYPVIEARKLDLRRPRR